MIDNVSILNAIQLFAGAALQGRAVLREVNTRGLETQCRHIVNSIKCTACLTFDQITAQASLYAYLKDTVINEDKMFYS